MRTRKDREQLLREAAGRRLTAGEQLSAAIHDRGINQTALARAVGCSQPFVSDLESGKALPSPDLARRIEAVVGMPATAWAEEEVSRAAAAAAKSWREGAEK